MKLKIITLLTLTLTYPVSSLHAANEQGKDTVLVTLSAEKAKKVGKMSLYGAGAAVCAYTALGYLSSTLASNWDLWDEYRDVGI
jgi:fructose-1,6-bisphosphatase/inositol monophosphatase family enzyme